MLQSLMTQLNTHTSGFGALPNEVSCHILSFLPTSEASSVFATSRQFKRLGEDQQAFGDIKQIREAYKAGSEQLRVSSQTKDYFNILLSLRKSLEKFRNRNSEDKNVWILRVFDVITTPLIKATTVENNTLQNQSSGQEETLNADIAVHVWLPLAFLRVIRQESSLALENYFNLLHTKIYESFNSNKAFALLGDQSLVKLFEDHRDNQDQQILFIEELRQFFEGYKRVKACGLMRIEEYQLAMRPRITNWLTISSSNEDQNFKIKVKWKDPERFKKAYKNSGWIKCNGE
jgi:hypothetical protein